MRTCPEACINNANDAGELWGGEVVEASAVKLVMELL